MVDAETGRIVDMLESRESTEVSKWLTTYPNLNVVMRDGSQMYAKAIRMAHPDALQVSDRFHIFKGLTDAARQFILSFIPQRIAVPSDTPASSYWQKQPRAKEDLPGRLHDASTKRRTAAVEKVQELAGQGLNISQISKVTGYCWSTVKKYLAPNFEPAFSAYGMNRPSKLKPYCNTIDAMLDEGRKFREIAAKIRDMGYGGSDSTIRMYASRKRRHDQAATAQGREGAQVIERKYLLKLLYKPMDKIKGFTCQQLDKVLTLYPQLHTLYDLIRDFKAIFAAHHPEDLGQWLASAAAIGSPDITSFANGITRDIDAVRNAIIYDYNNGIAEGCVNKIKRFKHTMYGRASFSILRTKVLLEQNWRCLN